MIRLEIDDREFKRKLEKFSKNKFENFVRKNINDLLFDIKKFTITDRSGGMQKQFTIRQRGLLRSHLHVQKAIGVIGYFGSIESPRFTGWSEQQKGTPVKRDHVVHTRHARGPSAKRKLREKFRRNAPSENLLRYDTVKGATGSYRQMVTANLARLRRKKYTGPVTLPIPFGKRKPGIYKMLKSGKLKIMEIWEKKQPDRKNWAAAIVKNYFRTGKADKVIEKNFKRFMRI